MGNASFTNIANNLRLYALNRPPGPPAPAPLFTSRLDTAVGSAWGFFIVTPMSALRPLGSAGNRHYVRMRQHFELVGLTTRSDTGTRLKRGPSAVKSVLRARPSVPAPPRSSPSPGEGRSRLTTPRADGLRRALGGSNSTRLQRLPPVLETPEDVP